MGLFSCLLWLGENRGVLERQQKAQIRSRSPWWRSGRGDGLGRQEDRHRPPDAAPLRSGWPLSFSRILSRPSLVSAPESEGSVLRGLVSRAQWPFGRRSAFSQPPWRQASPCCHREGPASLWRGSRALCLVGRRSQWSAGVRRCRAERRFFRSPPRDRALSPGEAFGDRSGREHSRFVLSISLSAQHMLAVRTGGRRCPCETSAVTGVRVHVPRLPSPLPSPPRCAQLHSCVQRDPSVLRRNSLTQNGVLTL